MTAPVRPGSREAPPGRAPSDAKAALIGCGCLLLFLAADGVVTGVLIYLLLGWLD